MHDVSALRGDPWYSELYEWGRRKRTFECLIDSRNHRSGPSSPFPFSDMTYTSILTVSPAWVLFLSIEPSPFSGMPGCSRMLITSPSAGVIGELYYSTPSERGK